MQNQLIFRENQLHKFRAASELKKEAKGGYLEGTFKIDHPAADENNLEQKKFPDLKLELFTAPKGEPHTHLLFITSNQRQKASSCKSE